MRLVLEVNILESVYLYFAAGRTFCDLKVFCMFFYFTDLFIGCVKKYSFIDLRSHAQLFMADNIMSICLSSLLYSLLTILSLFLHYPFCLNVRSYVFASKSHQITTTSERCSATCTGRQAVIVHSCHTGYRKEQKYF